ncbi:ceramidase-domain-containing protein [Syncephalis plumigaleata]|nr:ceramidase-domain-containing protein [Syncephalis plumigaleata]
MHLYMMESLNATSYSYWGKRTANIEWCEENYATCKYIAEFYNTITNALFIVFAIYGIYTAQKLKLERRFALTFASYMLIGVGSWGFHMTLLYEMQLMDELPMVFTTSMLLYLTFDTDNMSKRQRQLLPWGLAAISLFITATYLFVNHSLYYQCCYGALTITTVMKAAYAFNQLPANSLAKQELRKLLLISCARASIGEPWNGLLQLHGWWHILAGLGGYGFIVFCQYLRLSRLDKHNDYVVEWTMKIIPTLVSRSAKKAKLL